MSTSFHGRQATPLLPQNNNTNNMNSGSNHGRSFGVWDASSQSSIMPTSSNMKKDSFFSQNGLHTESLLGMALYDYDSNNNDTSGFGGFQGNMGVAGAIAANSARSHSALLNNSMTPAFHPIDEYKDLSLKEILELSDNVLAPDGHRQQQDTLLGIPSMMQQHQQMLGRDHHQQPLLSSTLAAQQRQLRQQRQLLQQQQLQLQLLEQQRMQLNLMNQVGGGSCETFDDLTPVMANNGAFEDVVGMINGQTESTFATQDDIFSEVPAPTPISSSTALMLSNSCHQSGTKRTISESAMISDSSQEDDDYFQNDNGGFDGDDELNGSDSNHERRFRPYQAGQWSEKYEELCDYRQKMGHCLVPHTYTENLALARWVKRQRYQYKLMMEGKSTTMTEERVKVLEDIGFVWDSQGAAWGDRLHELQMFKAEFHHCNVPSNYCDNPRLATWIKCQRRQHKLYMEDKPSNMTPMRINELERLGFEWELRSYKKARSD
jgi:Helicase associated domain